MPTPYTRRLIYAWQPGALNEAYSDIWGETVNHINTRGGDTPDAARTAGSCTVFSTAPPTVTVTEPPGDCWAQERRLGLPRPVDVQPGGH